MKRKNGFTLAEVLITLTIIGVVASMTLPTLNSNIGAAKNRAALKKALSTLNGAVKMNEAQNGWNFSGLTTACAHFNDNGKNETAENNFTVCGLLNDSLVGETYLRNVTHGNTPTQTRYQLRNNNGEALKGSAEFFVAYRLNDGTIIGLNTNAGSCTSENYKNDLYTRCSGFIDTNGIQGPNTAVECSNGTTYSIGNARYTSCDVKRNTNADIFPIAFYDSTVELGSNAAVAYFNAK